MHRLRSPFVLVLFLTVILQAGCVVKHSDQSSDRNLELNQVSNSITIDGTAELRTRSSSLEVGLYLRNLESGKKYEAMIHTGTCENVGGMAVGLKPVTGTDEDIDSSTTSVDFDQLASGEDHLIMVHRPDHEFALCAKLPPVDSLQ